MNCLDSRGKDLRKGREIVKVGSKDQKNMNAHRGTSLTLLQERRKKG